MSYQRSNISRMRGYTWGEQPLDRDTIKLNTNENPYPPSPRVQEALANLRANVLRTYPQPTADALRDRLAALHGVSRDHILVTHGGDEGLRLAMTTFVDPGAAFAMAEPSYSLYQVLAEVQDARTLSLPLDDAWRLPANAAAQLNAADARLTCIVNPHAPSGVLTSADELVTLARALNGVLLVDEAYVDFVAPDRGYDLVGRLAGSAELPNLLLLRTFSKGYSLAGLRLGYLIGHPDLIEPMLTKTRDSYNVDAISQALGEAAAGDQDHAARSWRKVRAERQALRHALDQLGLTTASSEANFLLAQVPAGARRDARQLYGYLKERRILVRYFDTPRLHDRLRISIGTEAQNRALIATLTEALHD
ncbi:MAG: histidinol-phosphate transaminase [Pseudomonadales bacterium]